MVKKHSHVTVSLRAKLRKMGSPQKFAFFSCHSEAEEERREERGGLFVVARLVMADPVDAQRVPRLARLVAQLLTHRRLQKMFLQLVNRKRYSSLSQKNKTASRVADPGCLSRIRIFSVPDPYFFIPDPGSASKNLSILTQKMVSKL
jgi:hypothetical protein